MNDPYPPNRKYYDLWTSITFLPKFSTTFSISSRRVFHQSNNDTSCSNIQFWMVNLFVLAYLGNISGHGWITCFSSRLASVRNSCRSMLSMKWPMCISSIPVLLNHCVRTHKTLGDKLSPLGNFSYSRFSIFSLELIKENPVWWEKTYLHQYMIISFRV